MAAKSYDAIVVGGGIVGTACAAEFANAGLRVAVVEQEAIGSGATGAGMGHIAVMDDSPAQFALTRYSQVLWRSLAPHLPDSVEYLLAGSLWIAADEEEMAEVQRKYQFYSQYRVPVEILDAHALAETEPALRRGLCGALRMSDDAVIYAPTAALFLAELAEAKGAQLVIGSAVEKVIERTAILANGTVLRGEYIVIANGTAAVSLFPELPIQPRKGHLVITDRYRDFVSHQLIELGYLKNAHSVHADSVAFNIQPRKTGQLLIGSSRQYGSADPAIEHTMLTRMLRRAVEYIPSLAGLQAIRSWTGFRAATPDKLPLIGPHPAQESIYLASGHEGLGISTSLATAALLADMLLGRPSQIDRHPYLPSRFLRNGVEAHLPGALHV